MKTFYPILFTCTSFLAVTREVVSSSGGEFSSLNTKLSWTPGEPVIETCNSSNCMITQGEHQSKLIVTSVQKNLMSSITIKAYPNPVRNYINLVLTVPTTKISTSISMVLVQLFWPIVKLTETVQKYQ